MNEPTIIGLEHPHDGRQWECQCARCGSSLIWEDCDACGGLGHTEEGELYEEDPNWYHPNDTAPCHQCGGQAVYPYCLSREEWCRNNPMQGRLTFERHTPEWFPLP